MKSNFQSFLILFFSLFAFFESVFDIRNCDINLRVNKRTHEIALSNGNAFLCKKTNQVMGCDPNITYPPGFDAKICCKREFNILVPYTNDDCALFEFSNINHTNEDNFELLKNQPQNIIDSSNIVTFKPGTALTLTKYYSENDRNYTKLIINQSYDDSQKKVSLTITQQNFLYKTFVPENCQLKVEFSDNFDLKLKSDSTFKCNISDRNENCNNNITFTGSDAQNKICCLGKGETKDKMRDESCAIVTYSAIPSLRTLSSTPLPSSKDDYVRLNDLTSDYFTLSSNSKSLKYFYENSNNEIFTLNLTQTYQDWPNQVNFVFDVQKHQFKVSGIKLEDFTMDGSDVLQIKNYTTSVSTNGLREYTRKFYKPIKQINGQINLNKDILSKIELKAGVAELKSDITPKDLIFSTILQNGSKKYGFLENSSKSFIVIYDEVNSNVAWQDFSKTLPGANLIYNKSTETFISFDKKFDIKFLRNNSKEKMIGLLIDKKTYDISDMTYISMSFSDSSHANRNVNSCFVKDWTDPRIIYDSNLDMPANNSECLINGHCIVIDRSFNISSDFGTDLKFEMTQNASTDIVITTKKKNGSNFDENWKFKTFKLKPQYDEIYTSRNFEVLFANKLEGLIRILNISDKFLKDKIIFLKRSNPISAISFKANDLSLSTTKNTKKTFHLFHKNSSSVPVSVQTNTINIDIAVIDESILWNQKPYCLRIGLSKSRGYSITTGDVNQPKITPDQISSCSSTVPLNYSQTCKLSSMACVQHYHPQCLPELERVMEDKFTLGWKLLDISDKSTYSKSVVTKDYALQPNTRTEYFLCKGYYGEYVSEAKIRITQVDDEYNSIIGMYDPLKQQFGVKRYSGFNMLSTGDSSALYYRYSMKHDGEVIFNYLKVDDKNSKCVPIHGDKRMLRLTPTGYEITTPENCKFHKNIDLTEFLLAKKHFKYILKNSTTISIFKSDQDFSETPYVEVDITKNNKLEDMLNGNANYYFTKKKTTFYDEFEIFIFGDETETSITSFILHIPKPHVFEIFLILNCIIMVLIVAFLLKVKMSSKKYIKIMQYNSLVKKLMKRHGPLHRELIYTTYMTTAALHGNHKQEKTLELMSNDEIITEALTIFDIDKSVRHLALLKFIALDSNLLSELTEAATGILKSRTNITPWYYGLGEEDNYNRSSFCTIPVRSEEMGMMAHLALEDPDTISYSSLSLMMRITEPQLIFGPESCFRRLYSWGLKTHEEQDDFKIFTFEKRPNIKIIATNSMSIGFLKLCNEHLSGSKGIKSILILDLPQCKAAQCYAMIESTNIEVLTHSNYRANILESIFVMERYVDDKWDIKNSIEHAITACSYLVVIEIEPFYIFKLHYKLYKSGNSELWLRVNKQKSYPCTVAQKPQNRSKNRYSDIMPNDKYRVKLNPTIKNEDYINASFVTLVTGNQKHRFISHQGPLPHTVQHTWYMYWQNKIKAILNLTKNKEKGIEKCAPYIFEKRLPDGSGYEPFTVGPDDNNTTLTITVIEKSKIGKTIVRLLEINANDGVNSSTSYIVNIAFLGWPDHGVPDPEEMERLLFIVTRPQSVLQNMSSIVHDCINEATERGILAVHCSAGIGRTGTCEVIIHVFKLDLENCRDIDIEKLIRQIRKQRPFSIQTKGQFDFAILMIHRLISRYLNSTET